MRDLYEMWFIDTHTLETGVFFHWSAPEHEVLDRVDAWNEKVRRGECGSEILTYAFFARPEVVGESG